MPISEPGVRDRYLMLQQRTSGVGPTGRPLESWSALRPTWAMKMDGRGAERFRSEADLLAPSMGTSWTIPYSADMDPEIVNVPATRRILYRGAVYDIVAAGFENGVAKADFGFDDIELMTIFNCLTGVAASPPLAPPSPAQYQLVEDLGGDAFAFVTPLSSDAYPVGATFDKLVPGSYPVVLNRAALATGKYYVEANGRVSDVGGRLKVGIFDLTNAPNTPLVELTFTTSEVVGERKRSASFSLHSGDTLYGVKLTVNSLSIGGAAWGCRIVRA